MRASFGASTSATVVVPRSARFRFVVQDGEPDRALLDAYWHGYASPAQPQLGRP